MSTPDLRIRTAREDDWPALWPILRQIIRAGDTYAIDPQISETAARQLWLDAPRAVYVAERAGEMLGSYFMKSNHAGGGSHVCNCGYIVSPSARGQGIAAQMCEHSQTEAIKLGYSAMQFNLVVSTNVGAIRLWERLGFTTVGVLPGAFHHPSDGFVDARVMYKWLIEPSS